TAHEREVGIFERLGLLKILGLRIHHPNLSVGDIRNLAACALENPREDRRLVLQQEGAEGDRENQAKILGPIACEHFPCNEVHRSPPQTTKEERENEISVFTPPPSG